MMILQQYARKNLRLHNIMVDKYIGAKRKYKKL